MQLDFLAKLSPRRIAAAFIPRPATMPPAASATPPPELAALLDRVRTLLRGLGCESLAGQVDVRWNARMRSTAGMAFSTKALITLNPRLREFGDEAIDRTLLHELAHLLAHHRAGRRRINAHGPEWRQACADLGIAGEKRCHELALPRRKINRTHLYQCPQCGVEVRRVRPLKGKSACLACCRTHANGRYDARFRFIKVTPT